MTLDESIKNILEKINNDNELRKLAVLIDTHPEYKDEILRGWAHKAVEDTNPLPPHNLCKQEPDELCRRVDELYQETFGDLGTLFKIVPHLNRFEDDML